MAESEVTTSQPKSNSVLPSGVQTSQPKSESPDQRGKEQSADQLSYADSDAHAAQFYCGCMRCCTACCAYGDDKRWYYPWDKGPLCCFPLGCGWCFLGLVFPCCICIPWCRNIVCLVQEGAWEGTCFGECICGIPRTGGRKARRRTDSEDSED